MVSIFKPLIILLLPAFLLIPRIDAVFSATMQRKALAEVLLLLFCGWLLSRVLPRRPPWHAPSVVAAATLLFLFWMIPRSIDLTQLDAGANVLYVISIFAVAYLLSSYLPGLPSVIKVAYGLYVPSMIVALGLLYASQTTLLCSAFTLEDQHAFGRMIIALGIAVYLVVLASTPRWLTAPVNRR